MVFPLLLWDAAFGALSAGLFGAVAITNWRRRAGDADGRRALRAFSAWWAGFAAMTMANATKSFLAGIGDTTLVHHVILQVVGDACLCVALWGLSSYLLYVYRGKHDAEIAARAYFSLLFVFLAFVTWWRQPTSVETLGWNASLVVARPIVGAPFVLVLLAILGPPILLAIAYARLYTRATDTEGKRRIALVSGSLTLWFGLNFFANASTFALGDGWPLMARGLAVAATLLIIYAYRPTRASVRANGT